MSYHAVDTILCNVPADGGAAGQGHVAGHNHRGDDGQRRAAAHPPSPPPHHSIANSPAVYPQLTHRLPTVLPATLHAPPQAARSRSAAGSLRATRPSLRGCKCNVCEGGTRATSFLYSPRLPAAVRGGHSVISPSPRVIFYGELAHGHRMAMQDGAVPPPSQAAGYTY
jgi:hypothetical protein